MHGERKVPGYHPHCKGAEIILSQMVCMKSVNTVFDSINHIGTSLHDIVYTIHLQILVYKHFCSELQRCVKSIVVG